MKTTITVKTNQIIYSYQIEFLLTVDTFSSDWNNWLLKYSEITTMTSLPPLSLSATSFKISEGIETPPSLDPLELYLNGILVSANAT